MEVAHYFTDEGLHGSDVDYLEILDVKFPIVLTLGTQYLEYGKQCDVSLSSSSGCTDKQVLMSGESLLIDP